MRGTPNIQPVFREIRGIIPAYAGNTRIALFRFRKIWDHPRVCGEHWSYQLSTMFPEGSSPRMRGTQTMADQPQATPGIIPAYAGNTYSIRAKKLFPKDHPRVCGEHCWMIYFFLYF